MGGSSIGHVIPGVALYFWSLAQLIILRQVQQQAWTMKTGLRAGALFQLVGSSIAVGQELFGGYQMNDLFHNKDHLTLHSVYFFSGLVFLAESSGQLPRESWKLAQCFVNFCIALLLYVHSDMQRMEEHHPVEGFTHWILAVATFGSSFGYAISWGVPSLRVGGAYLGIIWLSVQGMWLLFQSFALYSGYYGDMGETLEMATATSLFIWCFIFSTAIVTFFESKVRLAAGYDDELRHSSLPLAKSTGITYNKVDNTEVEAMLH